MATKNYRIVLRSRPGEDSEPSEENFGFEEIPYTPDSLADGEILVKNLYLSLDPAMRCRLNEDSGVTYIKSLEVGDTVKGFGGIGQVIVSKDINFSLGDLVIPHFEWPWQSYFVLPSSSLKTIPKEISALSPTLCLSVFGLTGLTAYLGVKERGHVTAEAKQTMVISGAAGSTGSFAGQIARVEGCEKIVGICGSVSKCQWLVDELKFDAAINYKAESVSAKLKEFCPDGIDIYFDNVGGSISDDVIRQMNPNSHVILCGQIAVYNKKLPYPPPIPEDITATLTERNITRERFLVLDYQDKFDVSIHKLMELYRDGKIKVKETVEQGLENAGKAFVSMMKGGNIGKQLVQVASVGV